MEEIPSSIVADGRPPRPLERRNVSSLLERRRRSSFNAMLPGVDCDSRSNEACCSDISPGTTTASSLSRHPSPNTSVSPLRNRKLSRPQIDCDLIQKEQQNQSDPFANPDCRKLADRYESFTKLGEGSCGVVYRAKPVSADSDVALKVMRMQDEERLLIAKKEFDLLSKVSHPNIIRALDFFTFPMGAVLVLEFFEGKSLEATVLNASGGCLVESIAFDLFLQLLQAVAHLHAHGFIHRDVKADNVLVSADMANLRLVDFNAAKNLTEGGALTMTGTVDYMPPEVLKGDSPSEASDVWALGLCLHFMLVGSLPATRNCCFKLSPEAMAEKCMPVQLEDAKWEDISEHCKTIVHECLDLNPEVRPQAQNLLSDVMLKAHQ